MHEMCIPHKIPGAYYYYNTEFHHLSHNKSVAKVYFCYNFLAYRNIKIVIFVIDPIGPKQGLTSAKDLIYEGITRK